MELPNLAMFIELSLHRTENFVFRKIIYQGIIDPTETETFAKELKFAKLYREVK